MALLELRDVSKAFGGLQVTDHLSFHVDEGEIVSVIGPNGAGKTTVFNLITGIFHVDSGEIVFEGDKISGLAPHRITNRGIARTFQRSEERRVGKEGRSRWWQCMYIQRET